MGTEIKENVVTCLNFTASLFFSPFHIFSPSELPPDSWEM